MQTLTLALLASALLANLIMGAVVLRRAPRSLLHICYSCATLFLALWSLLNFLWVLSPGFQTPALARASFVCVPIVAYFFLCFAALAPRRKPGRMPGWMAWLGVATTVLAVVTAFTPIIMRGLEPGGWGRTSLFGLLFPVYVAFGVVLFLSGIILLEIKRRAARDPFDRAQMSLLAVAAWLPFVTSLPLYFIPYALGRGSPMLYLTVLLPATSVPALLLDAYCILRYQLFDMRLMARRALVISGLAAVYSFLMGLIPWNVFNAGSRGILSAGNLALVGCVVGALILYPVFRAAVSHLVDQVVFRGVEELEETVRRFGRRLARVRPLEELARDVCVFLRETFEATGAAFFVCDAAAEPALRRVMQDPEDFQFEIPASLAAPAACYAETTPRILTRYEIELKNSGHPLTCLLPLFDAAGADVFVPLASAGRFLGAIIVGRRARDAAYTARHVRLLETLVDAAVPALLNADLYDRIETSHRRYRGLFERAGDAMFLVSGPRHLVHEANARAERLFGYERMELLGMPIDTFAAPEHRDRVLRWVAGPRPASEANPEVKLRKRDGALFPAELYAAALRDGVTVVNIRDLTRTRELEQQALHREKMDAIGTLAVGIAHDFNNHLAGIVGYASLLRRQTPGGQEAPKGLRVIERFAGRAVELTRQLLRFASGEKYPVERVFLDDAARRALNILSPTIHPAVRVEMHLNRNTPPIVGNRARLEQALLNLCLNAQENMPKGGTLAVAVGPGDPARAIAAGCIPALAGNCVHLSISDTGQGIDPEILPRMFDPFFTTKEHDRGIGMGLAVVHGVVTAHRGHIRVTSRPGEGARFDIFFPVCERMSAAGMADAQTPRLRRNAAILIVEGDADLREMCSEMLAHEGFRAIESPDGDTALKVLQARASEIDLVILDRFMPGLPPADTIEQMKTIRPDLRILLTSSYRVKNHEQTPFAQETVGVLMKPYTMDDLLHAVACALEGITSKT